MCIRDSSGTADVVAEILLHGHHRKVKRRLIEVAQESVGFFEYGHGTVLFAKVAKDQYLRNKTRQNRCQNPPFRSSYPSTTSSWKSARPYVRSWRRPAPRLSLIHIWLDGLRAGDVVESVVERTAFEPGESLDFFGAERRVVFARTHFAERIGKSCGADERRGGVGEDVEIGPDPGGETVVNLPPERRVAVERRVAEQQPDPLGQQRADAFVAAKDVDLVDALHLSLIHT